MSDQLPPLVSHQSLRVIAAAAKVGDVSSDVLSFLSASAEYHLLDVVNEASNFCARGKRSRLSADDVNAALELRGTHGFLFFSGGGTGEKPKKAGSKGGAVASADSKVDLQEVMNSSLPFCPIEPGFDMHWLAVDGQQPLIPQNPLTSTSKGAGKAKGGKRARKTDSASSVQPRLSEELTTYLRRCCEAILSRDDMQRERALASLRSDPGLQQLLPHLCTFIQTKVLVRLKKEKDPDQIAAMLQMLQCLLSNSHFAFLEIYLDRLIPPVLSCMLHSDFARRQQSAGGEGWGTAVSTLMTKSNASSSPTAVEGDFKWTHWKVRDYAAELLRAICDKHGQTYPTLQARASDIFCTMVSDPKTRLTTLYGAIKGLVCLGALTVEQTISPRIDALALRISRSCKDAVAARNLAGVENANRCLWALIQAAGSTTMSSCESLFGKTRGTPKTSNLTSTAAAANVTVKVKEEPVVVGGAETVVRNGNNSATQGGGFGAGSTIGFRKGKSAGASSCHSRGDHRAIIHQRVDRSRYPPSKPATPAKLKKIKEATAALERLKCEKNPTGAFGSGDAFDDDEEAFRYRKNGKAQAGAVIGLGAGAGVRPVKPESMEIEGEERRSGVSMKRRGGADWGTGELDEMVLPWYMFGLAKEQQRAPQARWLLDMNTVHV